MISISPPPWPLYSSCYLLLSKLYSANSFEKLKALAQQLRGHFFQASNWRPREVHRWSTNPSLTTKLQHRGKNLKTQKPALVEFSLGFFLLLSLQLMISNQVDQCLVQIVFITAMLFPYRYCWVERSDHCCLAMVFRQKHHYRQGLSPWILLNCTEFCHRPLMCTSTSS